MDGVLVILSKDLMRTFRLAFGLTLQVAALTVAFSPLSALLSCYSCTKQWVVILQQFMGLRCALSSQQDLADFRRTIQG